jgi:hypothetical protein
VGSYPVSLPSQLMKQWGQSQPSIDSWLLGLSGSYHRHAIGTFNTCSRGLTIGPQLTQVGATTLEVPTVSTFHLRAPSDLQFSGIPPIFQDSSFKESMAATWSFDHSVIYHNLPLRLAIANDLSLAIRFTRIDRKITLMQLGHQFNSYNLMHIKES